MTSASFQIRLCRSCGLRYPLLAENGFGERCPSCLGATDVVATHPLRTEVRARDQMTQLHLEGLIDNIRSAWNVGSIFRTADGFGLGHLHLCGITPSPENESVRKTALGSENAVPWNYSKNAVLTAETLKSQGARLLALEETEHSIPIQDAKLQAHQERHIIVVGNEITGIDPELLDLCDEVMSIPMHGVKKSFNAAVAFAVAVSQFAL